MHIYSSWSSSDIDLALEIIAALVGRSALIADRNVKKNRLAEQRVLTGTSHWGVITPPYDTASWSNTIKRFSVFGLVQHSHKLPGKCNSNVLGKLRASWGESATVSAAHMEAADFSETLLTSC